MKREECDKGAGMVKGWKVMEGGGGGIKVIKGGDGRD